MYISLHAAFAQYFVEAPLAAATASSLFEYDAISLAHLFYGWFLPFSCARPLKHHPVGR